MKPAFRWALVPVLAVGSCSAAGIGSLGLESMVSTAGSMPIEDIVPLDVRKAAYYFAMAAIFVVGGSRIAPRFRTTVAVSLFAVGAWAAWEVLGYWTFPEFHPRAYQRSLWPLRGCLAGGLVGVTATFVRARARGKTEL